MKNNIYIIVAALVWYICWITLFKSCVVFADMLSMGETVIQCLSHIEVMKGNEVWLNDGTSAIFAKIIGILLVVLSVILIFGGDGDEDPDDKSEQVKEKNAAATSPKQPWNWRTPIFYCLGTLFVLGVLGCLLHYAGWRFGFYPPHLSNVEEGYQHLTYCSMELGNMVEYNTQSQLSQSTNYITKIRANAEAAVQLQTAGGLGTVAEHALNQLIVLAKLAEHYFTEITLRAQEIVDYNRGLKFLYAGATEIHGDSTMTQIGRSAHMIVRTMNGSEDRIILAMRVLGIISHTSCNLLDIANLFSGPYAHSFPVLIHHMVKIPIFVDFSILLPVESEEVAKIVTGLAEASIKDSSYHGSDAYRGILRDLILGGKYSERALREIFGLTRNKWASIFSD